MAQLPAWSPLWNEYPDYLGYTSEEVRRMVGGQVNAAWLTNTCAIRLSRTLNYNDLKLPASFPDFHYVLGADGLRYCYRVREIRRWLLHKIGKPQFEKKKKVNEPFDKAQLASLKGIIGFDINFADATGHLDLWDGRIFSSEHRMSRDYWSSATKIWLWTTASGA